MLPEYAGLIENENPGVPIGISGLSRIQKAHWLAALAQENAPPLLVIVESENEAMRLYDDISALGGAAAVYPAKDHNLIAADAQSCEYEHRRLSVLANLPPVILATPESAAQTTFSPEELANHSITVTQNSDIDTAALTEHLVTQGYARVDMVEAVSQFSLRGSVIDVFPVNAPAPVRIDLWGDTVESIVTFDTQSQRRVGKLDSVTVAPATESANDATLFDFVQRIVICEQTNCNEQFRAAYEQLKADIELSLEGGAIVDNRYMLSKSEYDAILGEKLIAKFDTFSREHTSVNIGTNQLPPWSGDMRQLRAELGEFLKCGYAIVVFAGTVQAAKSLANDLRDDGLPADYSEKPKKVFSRHIFVTPGTLSAGFEYPLAKCACITHLGIARRMGSAAGQGSITAGNASGNVRAKSKRKSKSETIRALTDINVGDYIVHDNYGIGIFEGVTKLTADGASKDYIKLKYAGKDVLYVPVTQLDFIARYIGNVETANLKLSKLNTDTWFNQKAKVKRAVEELAEELIELYSARMRAKGHKFGKDTKEQAEFENNFGYIETDDQLTCIEELKKDMQSARPMDRLLCGDVGYGKTEVALRGVFKCVMEGKQCALLCPTTVLAWQHYQTALQRMAGLPVNVELLSRFRSPKEKAEVVKKLESGVVDFVIGTHTVLGKSVKFKNLGLVIIDEEQRFGVNQKEKLKGLRSVGVAADLQSEGVGVDVLTLSATPIPRTLNMAMSGIRDMSVIETPPHDRIPVTTYVIEHDLGVVVGAIQKELRRAGQVYYVHNRVETIMTCAAKIHELVPQARIGVAHGKMDERELLDVWRKLLEREIDILVCTTLIETGIDVPNVNTLIIENADRMGLAQLHQLRGRVGRTNRRAYAYFTFARGKALSEIAEKRLNAVKEFTQFGAGFKIALRDLEIRGAGSVLGESQSGHLSTVGYETYVRLLEEAVKEAQSNADNAVETSADKGGEGALGNAQCASVSCVVDIKSDAFIPESYVSNQAQRIACYKKIAEIRDEEDARDVTDELTDRYGVIPKSVRGLIHAARLRNMAGALGIVEVTHVVSKGRDKDDARLVFYWENPDMQALSRLSDKYAKRVELNMTERVNVSVNLGRLMWNEKGRWHEVEAIDDAFGAAIEFLENMS
ncbi:MAG: transcription-repair coupling factor [Oscillospiraceae bacterium]|nr:transcription-repair coupling factor [Oscillospiraceae bacterium]